MKRFKNIKISDQVLSQPKIYIFLIGLLKIKPNDTQNTTCKDTSIFILIVSLKKMKNSNVKRPLSTKLFAFLFNKPF